MKFTNLHIYSSLLLAMTLGLGCSKTKETTSTATTSAGAGSASTNAGATAGSGSAAATPVPPTAPAAEEQTWEAFWPVFQAAVATGDVAKMTPHVQFGDAISESEWTDNASIWINEDMAATIAKSSAGDWTENPEEPGVYPVVWQAVATDDEGNRYESAMFLYFKKFDGKFRLFRVLAAG